MTDAEVAMARAMMSESVDITKMYVSLDQSKAYSEFRPRYSEELFKTIVDYCQETSPELRLAVDVGCGPGMSTLGFCKFFERVIGVDVSETQIACAPKDVPNCDFKVGYSDKLSFIKSGTVDLFCSGQSFHFMPHKETFEEADRVLRPGGTIALFGYGATKSLCPEITEVMQKVMATFRPYWPKATVSAVNMGRDITLPYAEHIRRDDLQIVRRITLEEYIGFLRSTWPFVALSKDHTEIDIAGGIRKELEAVLVKVNPPGDTTFDVTWDMYVTMARKPKT